MRRRIKQLISCISYRCQLMLNQSLYNHCSFASFSLRISGIYLLISNPNIIQTCYFHPSSFILSWWLVFLMKEALLLRISQYSQLVASSNRQLTPYGLTCEVSRQLWGVADQLGVNRRIKYPLCTAWYCVREWGMGRTFVKMKYHRSV